MLLDYDRAMRLMSEAGLDGLIAASPENFHYVSDFPDPYTHVLRDNFAFTVLPSDGEAILVVNHVENTLAERYSWIERHIYYASEMHLEHEGQVEIHPSPEAALNAALEEANLKEEKVGIDRSRLLASQAARIDEGVDTANLVDCTALFDTLRSIKTDEELERLRTAAEVTEAGIRAFFSHAKAGVTEIELGNVVQEAIVSAGGEFYKHHPGVLSLGAGANSAIGTAQPTDYELQDGDIARIDIGGICESYTSDIARVIAIGTPPSELRDAYETVVEAQQQVRERIEPGVTAAELFNVGQSAVRENGYPNYERGHVGHGVGLFHQEPPMLSPDNDRELEAGMVLAVEIPMHFEGRAGFNVEDVCLVTESGCERLTSLGYDLDEPLSS
jgi:Xaa-Pro aminopeptidase